MFATSSVASRLYGTFQVGSCLKRWFPPVKALSLVRLPLDLYPEGDDAKPEITSVYLYPIGAQPSEAVAFQFWIQNHKDAGKSAVSGAKKKIMTMRRRVGARLLSVQTALDPNEGFMKDEALTVGIHICVIAQEDARQKSAHACTLLNTSLTSSIACYFGDAATSDVTLKAEDSTLCGHKMVLAAQSALFKAMFQSGTMEDACEVVEMKEIDASTLRRLVSFLYGRTPNLLLDTVPLFVAADAHQVESLRWSCLQVLITTFTVTTALEYAQLAHKLSDDTLMDACIQFLTESANRVEIAEQDEMNSLMQNNPDLAQKLLVALMRHVCSKRKADEMS